MSNVQKFQAAMTLQANFNTQGGGIGGRTRLRNPKSAISKRRFTFKKQQFYERKTAIFGGFGMLSPLIGLIMGLLGASLLG